MAITWSLVLVPLVTGMLSLWPPMPPMLAPTLLESTAVSMEFMVPASMASMDTLMASVMLMLMLIPTSMALESMATMLV